ncbi:tubulin--tyrosine ligase-like protein 12 isoform X1 [Petromyzon marinus]|uniref:tubulin--tyrosine ligase-like protein 12 isoform X1 n=1 Tax=Petromyzon marinus TaxID=7757 RepID=UPI003F712634
MAAPVAAHVAGGGEERADAQLERFVALHGPALVSSGVPRQLWPRLHHKLSHEVFDAGEVFGVMLVVEEGDGDDGDSEESKHTNPGDPPSYKVIVTQEDGLSASDSNSIFLIDHAWTFRADVARTQLLEVPGLVHRMAQLMGLDFHGEVPDDDTVDDVLAQLWRYSQTYSLAHGSAEEKVPVWYIMDEFGSRIQHSDQPTFCTAPLCYLPEQLTYTLLWPVVDLEKGDEVTRDFAYGERDPLVRTCRLLPWRWADLTHVPTHVLVPPPRSFEVIFKETKESLPLPIEPAVYPKDKVFKVFAEHAQVRDNLHHPRFTLEEGPEAADILYLFTHYKDFRTLSEEQPCVMLSQFPAESLLTVKDCMAAMARIAAGAAGTATGVESDCSGHPAWLPATYNLQTELPQFVSCFQQRQARGEDNHWICKPWNLARGLDTHISNNLSQIIRQRESTPKVVCKYIENPVLFERADVGMVKFDIRYIVLLRSVNPLSLYVYNVFWLRFSNKPFSLERLDDYEKHFTVMNYAPGVVLKQVHHHEFIPLFESQNPAFTWTEVQADIFKAFVELFQAAVIKPAPYGIGHYPQSRAFYAIDLMLKWDTDANGDRIMRPQILEVNFNPDCTRACKYHPSFFDDVFSTLFLDESEGRPVTRLV